MKTAKTSVKSKTNISQKQPGGTCVSPELTWAQTRCLGTPGSDTAPQGRTAAL